MGFDKIEAVSLTDQFVQKIESMIISGELMPGDQLPPARELSARMGVSRPVISAGLIELEKMGFVEIVTRQGVYVSDYRKTGSLDTLTALLNYNGGVMRDDEVRSLIEVRSANECLCVKLVVERATQEELDGLAPLLDAIKSGRTDEERAEATFQFHHTLSVLSRNAFLPLLGEKYAVLGTVMVAGNGQHRDVSMSKLGQKPVQQQNCGGRGQGGIVNIPGQRHRLHIVGSAQVKDLL